MEVIKNIIAGLAGALALNILHETVKRLDHDAPRVDLIGEEALNKLITSAGGTRLRGNKLFTTTLAADVVSNALYYSMIGAGNKKHLVARGILYGTAAGIGALKLTEPMGLRDAPVTRTEKTKALTVGYYVFGGVVTALVNKLLRNN